MSPGEYARSYAKLKTWFWNGSEWDIRDAPIINYLQNNGSVQAGNAAAAYKTLMTALAQKSGIPGVAGRKNFNFDDYDYINSSINRCFIGKACPWEIQETLQLASQFAIFATESLTTYCLKNLGVDCGGFVANYWGEACPHMNEPTPANWTGMLPRFFWTQDKSRRRAKASDVSTGDAVIFFEGNLANPDKPDQKGSDGKWTNVGTRAFHIAVVEKAGHSNGEFTSLSVAESSGAPSKFGGSGVNVRDVVITGTGAVGGWVRCEEGRDSSAHHLYFVAPPWGWGPEEGYQL